MRIATLGGMLLLAAFLPTSLFAEEKTVSTEYYPGFYSNYRLPFKVEKNQEISAEAAKRLPAYVVVQRDSRGNIVDFKKYIDGELFIHHRYEYDDKGNWKAYRDMLKPD